VPTDEEPCTPPCVPTDEEPCVTPTPSVLPTVTPSVKGVRIVKPPVKPVAPRVLGTRLPNTGGAAPVGLLLLIGFGCVALGVSATVSTKTSR
jgi:hypothetical protein